MAAPREAPSPGASIAAPGACLAADGESLDVLVRVSAHAASSVEEGAGSIAQALAAAREARSAAWTSCLEADAAQMHQLRSSVSDRATPADGDVEAIRRELRSIASLCERAREIQEDARTCGTRAAPAVVRVGGDGVLTVRVEDHATIADVAPARIAIDGRPSRSSGPEPLAVALAEGDHQVELTADVRPAGSRGGALSFSYGGVEDVVVRDGCVTELVMVVEDPPGLQGNPQAFSASRMVCGGAPAREVTCPTRASETDAALEAIDEAIAAITVPLARSIAARDLPHTRCLASKLGRARELRERVTLLAAGRAATGNPVSLCDEAARLAATIPQCL